MTCSRRPLEFGETDWESPYGFSVKPSMGEGLTLDQKFGILDGTLPALGLTLDDVELYINRRRGYCDPLPEDWSEEAEANGVVFD